MTSKEFREMALSFPGSEEKPHFDRSAFKIINKRIFATLHEASLTANIKFTPQDQSIFCEFDPSIVYAVPNKWGEKGWTTIDLDKAPNELVLDALETAYKTALKK